MIVQQTCALVSAAFCGAMVAYVPTARQRGWPVGSMFERGIVPTGVYLCVMAFLLGVVGQWAWNDKASWWWLLWVVIASLIGAPFITSLFRSWSAAISLIGAPLLALGTVIIPFME